MFTLEYTLEYTYIQYLIVVFKGIHYYFECGYGCVHNGTDTEDCAVSYIL